MLKLPRYEFYLANFDLKLNSERLSLDLPEVGRQEFCPRREGACIQEFRQKDPHCVCERVCACVCVCGERKRGVCVGGGSKKKTVAEKERKKRKRFSS